MKILHTSTLATVFAIPSVAQFSIDWSAVGASAGGAGNEAMEVAGGVDWFGSSPNEELQSGFWNETIIERALFVRARVDFVLRPNGREVKLNVLANDLANFGPAAISEVDSTSANGGVIEQIGGWILYHPPPSNPAVDTFGYTLTDGIGHTDRGVVTVMIRETDATGPYNLLRVVGAPGDLTLHFAGVPGFEYRIEVAPAVSGPWEEFARAIAGSNGLFSIRDEIDRGPEAFYRTIWP